MEAFLGGVVFAALCYFIYTKVQAKRSSGSNEGGSGKDGPNPVKK